MVISEMIFVRGCVCTREREREVERREREERKVIKIKSFKKFIENILRR
jgi:hypothetical protein